MSTPNLQFLDPCDAAARHAWDEAVETLPGGTVFHTTAWMDVIGKGLGLAPRFAYLPGSRGSVRALIPLFKGGWARPERWLNLPQSASAEPLAADEDAKRQLLEALTATAHRQGVSALVMRAAHAAVPPLPAGWEARREQPMLRHVIDLGGASGIEMLARIQRRQREKFRSTQRKLHAAGFEVRCAGPAEIRQFARDVHSITLARHGLLALPERFFQALLAHLPGQARLAGIGAPAGPTLAFTLTLWARDRASFMYGSGLPTPQGADAYRVCLGTEIDAAARAGLAQFDFHETGQDREGLIVSKERWGAEQIDGSYLIISRQGTDSGLRTVEIGRASCRERV